MKIWYHEAIILLIKPSCLQQDIPKLFHFYENILSNKTKLHKNWALYSTVKRTGVVYKES